MYSCSSIYIVWGELKFVSPNHEWKNINIQIRYPLKSNAFTVLYIGLKLCIDVGAKSLQLNESVNMYKQIWRTNHFIPHSEAAGFSFKVCEGSWWVTRHGGRQCRDYHWGAYTRGKWKCHSKSSVAIVR